MWDTQLVCFYKMNIEIWRVLHLSGNATNVKGEGVFKYGKKSQAMAGNM